MRRGRHYQSVPRHVEEMEHNGEQSLARMVDWVVELRLAGRLRPGISFTTSVLDDGRPAGWLHVGPGVDVLITEGGHLVFHPDRRGGPGYLEVVDDERFHREFQPPR